MRRDRVAKINWVFLPSKLGVLELPVDSLPATIGTVQHYSLPVRANETDSFPCQSRSIRNRRQSRKDRNSSSGNE